MSLGYALAGLALLCAAVLPRVLSKWPISPAIIFVGVGGVAALIPGAPSLRPDSVVVEHLTEACVLVALMGVGLALDRPLSWSGWSNTWRLLAIGMPLFIAGAGFLAWGLLGLTVPAAMLLASALAPTDPVLASDVQVGEPTDDPRSEDEVRFSLSSEAGLNDGLAFPFVYAAILVSAGAFGWGWVGWELLGKIAIGVVVGWLIGLLLGKLAFRAPARALRFAETAETLVALSAVFITYGVAEVVGGYGFLAVFVCAVAIRACERGHEYHRVLHEFIGQIEKVLTLALLLGFGYLLGDGLLSALTPMAVLWGLGLVLLLRPITAGLSLIGGRGEPAEKRTIAFFGVRGVGTFYYVAYGLNHADFGVSDVIWATAAFAVLTSIVIHGVSASPVLRTLDRRAGRRTPDPV